MLGRDRMTGEPVYEFTDEEAAMAFEQGVTLASKGYRPNPSIDEWTRFYVRQNHCEHRVVQSEPVGTHLGCAICLCAAVDIWKFSFKPTLQ